MPGRVLRAGGPQETGARVLSKQALRQLHAAETEKYAHVTYFFNGGREEPWPGEHRQILVPSPRDVPSYDFKPEMAAPEVTERFCAEIGGGYAFAVLNFANPDMVGHTEIDPGGDQSCWKPWIIAWGRLWKLWTTSAEPV